MKKFTTLLLLCSIFTAGKTNAQFVYPNELCSGALPLTVSNNTLLNNTLFLSTEFMDMAASPIPLCNGATNIRRDVWYKFTATDTAISIVTQLITNSATVRFQLFTGNCARLVSVECYTNPTNNRLSNLTIGQEYYLRSYDPNPGSESFPSSDVCSQNVNLLSTPVNDDCTGAMELPVWDAYTEGTKLTKCNNAMATLTTSCGSVPSGWNNKEDVWYKFTATATTHSILIKAPSDGRAIVYSEQAGFGVTLGVFNFSVSVSALLRDITNLVPGQTYYIRFVSTDPANFFIGVYANAPANDDCSNADTVFMSNSFFCDKNFQVGNRLTATTSTGSCSDIPKDVWFIFKATSPTVTVRATEQYNPRLGLLQGTCGALTCLISSTTGEFSYSGLTVGNYYYLQVGGSTAQEPTTICISPGITNDECSGAIPLPVNPYGQLRNTMGYTGNATTSMPHCSLSGSYKDVWYSFIAPDTACLVTMDGSGGSFEVLSGACGALTGIHCSSNTSLPTGVQERTEKVSGLLPGNTYYVRLIGGNAGTQKLYTIDVNRLPSNDECSGAKELLPQQNMQYEPQDDNGILFASQSQAPCATSAYTNDIWYRFIATATSSAVLSHVAVAVSSPYVVGMQVYSGSCAGLTSLACITQGSMLHRAQTLTGLVPGNTYYIRQYGNVKNNTITVLNPPANDAITGAVQLLPSPTGVQTLPSYYNHAATRQFGRMCSSSPAAMDHDVWFYFVATAASHTVSAAATNSFWDEEVIPNVRIETFRGFAADSLSLVPKLLLCGNNSVALTGLTIGDTIYVRVASTAAGTTSVFSMKVSSGDNIDEPAGALLLTKKDDYEYAISTSGATQSLPATGCVVTDYPDDDVWFKFYAASDAKRIIAGKESRDISLQLFSGTPGSLTPLLCSNNIMVLPASLTNGQLYYVRAYSKENAQAASFRIGLYGEEGLDINSCNQAIASLGPNLVLNPRCESNDTYRLANIGSGDGVPGLRLAEGWWGINTSSPDAWDGDYPLKARLGDVPDNASYGKNKIPRSGKGMLGVLYQTEWNEYVTGKLTRRLTAGKTYFISFYIQFPETGTVSILNIGAYFSNDSTHGYSAYEPLEVTPQVGVAPGSIINARNKWYNVCGYFTADKDYQYITIGNFGDNFIYRGNGYMFIDDVLVAETNQGTLPLQLLNFNGRANAQQQNELYWVTASENNTGHFDVEWHAGSGQFEKIGTVQAAGNSSVNRYYNFLHTNPRDGYNYYRLKMVDRDGQFKYSQVLKIGNNKEQHLAVYPNPVTHSLNISATMKKEEMVLFKIIDSYGRTVATRQQLLQKGSNTFTWNISALAAGYYFLLSTGDGHSAIKLVKR